MTEYVSPGIARRMTEMAGEILDLRDARDRAEAAEARLAAVLALCDLSPHCLATDQARAAARGESDQ